MAKWLILLLSLQLASAIILGDSDNELRIGGAGWSGTNVDAAANIAALKAANANTFAYMIWHKPTDWSDLPGFLTLADQEGIDVWVYLPPPTSDGCGSITPYACDFVKWGTEIAKLANEHPSLKAWLIDDFFYNPELFSRGYIQRMQSEAQAIDPDLELHVIAYYYNAYNLKLKLDLLDGFVFPYEPYTPTFTAANREDEVRQVGFFADLIATPRTFAVFNYPNNQVSQIGDYARFKKEFDTAGLGELRFRITDSNAGKTTTGYHMFQLLVDSQVVWERDANGIVDDPATEVVVDITSAVAGKAKVNITAQCIDKQAVYSFPVAYTVDGLVDSTWAYDRTGKWNATLHETQATPSSYLVMIYAGDPVTLQSRSYAYTKNATLTALAGPVDGVMQYCLPKTQPWTPAFDGTRDAYALHSTPQCTPADTDRSNVIEPDELQAYILLWQAGNVGLVNLLDVILHFKNLCPM